MFNNVIITGASDGLGKAIALGLSKKNIKNLILTGRNIEKLIQTKNEIKNKDINVEIYAFDLGNIKETTKFIQNILIKYQYIDCLINNAGLNTNKSLIDNLDIDEFSYMMNANCIAPTLLMKEVIPSMRQNKKGIIINILSSVCMHDIPEFCGYAASKNAFKSINNTTRKSVKNDNINIIAVYPGGIDSNFREENRPLYLKPNELAEVIIRNLELPKNMLLQELLIRPIVEDNY